MIMKAPEIEEKGNQAMLDFGHALLKKQQSFTFPRAENLMDDYNNGPQMVSADARPLGF
jgi:hypothetical protein